MRIFFIDYPASGVAKGAYCGDTETEALIEMYRQDGWAYDGYELASRTAGDLLWFSKPGRPDLSDSLARWRFEDITDTVLDVLNDLVTENRRLQDRVDNLEAQL